MKRTKGQVLTLLLTASLCACSNTPLEPESPELSRSMALAGADTAQEEDQAYECDLETGFDFDRTRKAKDHILRFDNNGHFISSDVAEEPFFWQRMNAPPLTKGRVDEQLDHIFCQASKLARAHGASGPKILVFVHGGLNSFSSTDERLLENGTAQEIMRDSPDWHYPVFISWPTAALPTYLEHTFFIREGRRSTFWGPVTSPFMFASDLLRTVGRLPATLYYQLSNEKNRLASSWVLPDSFLSHSWRASRASICAYDDVRCAEILARRSPEGACRDYVHTGENNFHVNYSCYEYGGFADHSARFYSWLTLPVRMTIGSVWHSGIAQTAWDNMKRRADNIFYPPDYFFDERVEKGVAGSLFFSELNRRSRNEGNYSITLVGHSMGAIVLNEALKLYQVDWATTGALHNIVYMAAASSINETVHAVAPVLRGAGNSGRSINFYNLSLNRVAEISEMHAFGIVPSGSLLVSIDQHHESPESPLRRTMGSEVNVLSAMKVLEDAFSSSQDGSSGSRGDVVFKAFSRCGARQPYEHGGFGKLPFWRDEFWRQSAGGCE